MNIIDIENMNAATLKGCRAEAVEAVAGDAKLAQRYVQARLDATTRDERMAEQGRTITVLQDAAEQSSARIADLERQLGDAGRALKQATSTIDALKGAVSRATTENAELSARAAANLDLARRRRLILADITSMVAPLLAEE